MNILEARRRTLGKGVYKKTVEGNPAIAQGSLARMYPGITMQGWTKQNGTPTPETPVPIVSAGTQNQDTGKWEYEITIANAQADATKNQTVTLTSDRPLTKWDKLEKRNGQWGWVYKSAEINITDESPLQKYGDDKISLYVSDAYLLGTPYCEKYVCQNGVPATENRIGLSSGSHAFVIYDTRYLDNVESYKQWLSENPLTLWYETTEETFVPLSESEQEQMNALHTFRPTTVLSNDCDCNMILTYKTKKSLEVTT